MPTAPDGVEYVDKDKLWLGKVSINYQSRSRSYSYYLGQNIAQGAAETLLQNLVKNYLAYVIPTGSIVVDATVYRPDTAKDGWPAINGDYPSKAPNIMAPSLAGDGGANGIGFVPNDYKTALHFLIKTAGWKGREFFQWPPDLFISDNKWKGADWVNNGSLFVRGGTGDTAEETLSTNSSDAVTGFTKEDGTYSQRLCRYYQYIGRVLKKEYRQIPGNDSQLAISEIQTVFFRRVTSFRPGRAFTR